VTVTHAVEKVAVLCRFLDVGSVTKNHLLKYSLAHAFCCFLASVEDVNPAVATRARLLLDTIKRPALQVPPLHSSRTTQPHNHTTTQPQIPYCDDDTFVGSRSLSVNAYNNNNNNNNNMNGSVQ